MREVFGSRYDWLREPNQPRVRRRRKRARPKILRLVAGQCRNLLLLYAPGCNKPPLPSFSTGEPGAQVIAGLARRSRVPLEFRSVALQGACWTHEAAPQSAFVRECR